MKAARFGVVCAAVLGGVLIGTGTASADCSSTCSVGGFGTGGQSSNGAAQGFHYQQPVPSVAGATVSNSGNQTGGNITVTGTVSGMAGGAFTPQGVVVGHYTGFVANSFGVPDPCSGVCG
jgi:hypothetical protein